ncbi:MAG TPA: hypothetical protein VIH57_18345 [Bacteroidales bacterium]
MQNYNQNPVPTGLKDEMTTQLRLLREKLPTPPPIGPSERKVIQTINEVRKPFVEKSLNYGEKVPSILPPFVNITELKMDLTAYGEYADLVKEYDLLGKKLNDLMFAAGADCFYASLAIYSSAKMALRSGMSEAKPIVDDLKGLFEKETQESGVPTTK